MEGSLVGGGWADSNVEGESSSVHASCWGSVVLQKSGIMLSRQWWPSVRGALLGPN
jgi:hypothetical protein